jgi:hypothetical protein
MASAVVSVNWGNVTQSVARAASGRAKPAFVSPSAMGVNIYVQPGGTGTPVFKAALQRPQSSASISLPIGYNVIYAASYDAWDSVNSKGTGKLLAASVSGSSLTVVASPATNNVTVTLNPIVGGVSFDTSAIHDGTSGTVSIPVNALDPDGNAITGSANYANGALVVNFSDAFGSFTGFPSAAPNFTAPGGSVSMTFNGANDCSASLTGAASAYSLPAWLGSGTTGGTTTVQSLESGGSTGFANAWFGRLTVCWQPLSGASAYNVYRGTSPGGESSTAYTSFATSGQLGLQDYSVSSGQNYYYVVCTGALNTSTCTPEFSGSPSGDVTTIGSSPTYWFDANDTSTFTGSKWKDKSGHGYDLNVTGFTSTSNAFSIVGRTALKSASGNYASTTSGSLSTPLTVFAVAAQSASNGSQYQRLINFGTGDNRGFVGTWASSTSAYPGRATAFWGNNATSGYGNCNNTWCDTHANGPLTSWYWTLSPAPNAPSVLAVVNDGSCPTYICGAGSGQGGPLSYYNGAVMNQDHNGTMTATTGIEIGGFSGGTTSQYWNGYIGEVVIYPAALSQAQRQKIEGYLACKWGFQAALPSGHPYASGNQCP